MPINKSQHIRYRVLDRCFSNFGRKYFIDDLVNACNEELVDVFGYGKKISKRTIQYDIEFMESEEGWSIPLKRIEEGKQVYYRYEDEYFTIDSIALSKKGWNQLQMIFDLLIQIEGVPELMDFYRIEEVSHGKIQNRKKQSYIQFDSNIYLKGMEYFGSLLEGIQNNSVLKIKYKPFKTAHIREFHFHPYLLKQYNQRWFCFGLNEENGISTWNIALDRIVSIESSSKEYLKFNIDWNEYFEDIVGVTVINQAPVENIKILLSESIKEYIETKPIHGSQKLRKTEDRYFLELKVKINNELLNLLRSFGDSITIIEPSNMLK